MRRKGIARRPRIIVPGRRAVIHRTLSRRGRISESIRRMRAFVPFSFVDRDRSAALHAYDSVRQKIWRIGEYDIELEVETVQKFDAVSVRQREALWYASGVISI